MKMKPEHFAQLAAAVQVVRQNNPGVSAATYAAKGLTEKRYRWDLLYACKIDGRSGNLWICDLYSYLNDDHIDTALRAVVKKGAL